MKIAAAPLAFLLCITGLCSVLRAQPTPTPEEHREIQVTHLFAVMHLEDTERQMLQQTLKLIIDMRRKDKPNIPAKFWNDASKIMVEEFEKSLADMNKGRAVIYLHHFTETDIASMIAFYESPTGQKIIKETPAINQETFLIGKEWGREVGMRAGRRLKELAQQKGYVI